MNIQETGFVSYHDLGVNFIYDGNKTLHQNIETFIQQIADRGLSYRIMYEKATSFRSLCNLITERGEKFST